MKPDEVQQVMEFPSVFLAGFMAFVFTFGACVVSVLLYIGAI